METDPVLGERFYGRRVVLETLEKRLLSFHLGYRQNIGLIGHPFTGKSSVIAHFLESKLAKPFIPVLIRLEEVDSYQTFSQKWLGGILHGYRRFLGLPTAPDFQTLVKEMRKLLPHVMKLMRIAKKLAEKKEYNESYSELLRLLVELHEETKQKILLVMDGFDRLSFLPLKDPFAKLGKEIMLQKNTMYVVSSSNPVSAREIFKEKLSLLFSNFEVIEIGHFSFDDAAHWIKKRLGGAFAGNFLGKVLLLLTNGHPFYLDVLIGRLETLLKIKRIDEVSQEILEEALELELFNSSGALYQHCLMKIFSMTRSRAAYIHGDVLLAIARGNKKVSKIVNYLGKSSEEVKKILQRLTADHAVQKHGAFYDLSDSLFRFWLAEVYFRKRVSFDLNYAEHRIAFRQSLRSFIQLFETEDRKDLSLRIESLFRSFKNEVVEFGDRKIKLPKFTDITLKPRSHQPFPITAHSLHANWLCQIANDRVQEDDVRSFLNESKSLGHKIQQRFLIALRGIELNAKLLAQEAKLQLLDLRDLNVLLDLYGQPKVVI